MADIQHKNITDPQLHEPKGITTAAEGEVYVADGDGSGTWSPQISNPDTRLAAMTFKLSRPAVGWNANDPNHHYSNLTAVPVEPDDTSFYLVVGPTFRLAPGIYLLGGMTMTNSYVSCSSYTVTLSNISRYGDDYSGISFIRAEEGATISLKVTGHQFCYESVNVPAGWIAFTFPLQRIADI